MSSREAYSTQYTAYSTQHTVHSIQYKAYSTQHTVQSIQYKAYSTKYCVNVSATFNIIYIFSETPQSGSSKQCNNKTLDVCAYKIILRRFHLNIFVLSKQYMLHILSVCILQSSSMQSACAVSHCQLCPLCLYRIFPHNVINDTVLGKSVCAHYLTGYYFQWNQTVAMKFIFIICNYRKFKFQGLRFEMAHIKSQMHLLCLDN
jgi:hypothetical protein